jgi:predicted CoA-binding protein
MDSGKERVVILGASNKVQRYSNKAQKALAAAGHTVIPVNPAFEEIDGIKTVHSVKDINDKIDTVTLYVGPERLVSMIPDIIALNPARIISNPGTECAEMKEAAETAGIRYMEACTLVMLSTGQY